MTFRVGDLVKVKHYYKSYIAIIVKIVDSSSYKNKYELIEFKPTIPNITLRKIPYIDENYISTYSVEHLKCDNYKMYKAVLMQQKLIKLMES